MAGREHVLPERYDTLLEPGTGSRLWSAGNGEEVGACVAPYPLRDELPNPVVHARHGLVRICKVRRDSVEDALVRADDGCVTRVVTLKAEREGGRLATEC